MCPNTSEKGGEFSPEVEFRGFLALFQAGKVPKRDISLPQCDRGSHHPYLEGKWDGAVPAAGEKGEMDPVCLG